MTAKTKAKDTKPLDSGFRHCGMTAKSIGGRTHGSAPGGTICPYVSRCPMGEKLRTDIFLVHMVIALDEGDVQHRHYVIALQS